ncbi:hypothetical protein STEG23_035405, partial [Scotinomys teguina]
DEETCLQRINSKETAMYMCCQGNLLPLKSLASEIPFPFPTPEKRGNLGSPNSRSWKAIPSCAQCCAESQL